jgi:nucleotide-binding universal stress UspA family protein
MALTYLNTLGQSRSNMGSTGHVPWEVTVYQHLLVATDGSKLSTKAVAHAIVLAKALGARLTVFYASPGYPTPVYAGAFAYVPMMTRTEYNTLCAKEADKILKPASLRGEEAGLEVKSVHVIADAPWEAILAAARRKKCDAIVMASHGRRGVSALLLGSETQKVLTHTKVPVMVVR